MRNLTRGGNGTPTRHARHGLRLRIFGKSEKFALFCVLTACQNDSQQHTLSITNGYLKLLILFFCKTKSSVMMKGCRLFGSKDSSLIKYGTLWLGEQLHTYRVSTSPQGSLCSQEKIHVVKISHLRGSGRHFSPEGEGIKRGNKDLN